ncbi:uncharacterized protein LOC133189286 [Saccostrea echinata]|uniref:uncharacterized protein LOC133189286 n=1 Tax=Saccostrea echinata TaxID=191078 RepID=UPI002A8141E2|nr:uncharacterized protein LOC133189286 [Saccostrea echinata]
MGNAPPRNSYKVDPDYTSTGSTESLPSPRCYRYNLTQGKSQGQYVTPTMTMKISCENLQHLCCSPDGTVWVCRRPQILQLNSKGQHQLVLEVKIEICGLAASKKGSLVFTDGKNKRLICTEFNDDVITKKVMSTDDWYPIGVCCAENGDILVGLFKPEEQGKVNRYGVNGETRDAMQQDSSGSQLFKFPAFVTENGNGDVVVSDHLRRSVIVVDRWGRYRFTYTAEKLNRPDAVPFLPFGVCCDSLLNIIVSDCCNDCVHLISVNGEFLHLLFDKTSGLYRPVALSMSSEGKLYIGDRNGIKVFELDSHRSSVEDGKGSRANSFSSVGQYRISNDNEKLKKLESFQVMCKSKSSLSLKLTTAEGNNHNYNFGVGTPSSRSKTRTLSNLPRNNPNIAVSPNTSRNKASTLPRVTALLSKSVSNLNTIASTNTSDIVKPVSSFKTSTASLASPKVSSKHSTALKDKPNALMTSTSLVNISPQVSRSQAKLNSAAQLTVSTKTTSEELSNKMKEVSVSALSNKSSPATLVVSSSNKQPTSSHISKTIQTSNAVANKPVASKTTMSSKGSVTPKSNVTEKVKSKAGVLFVDSAPEALESSKTLNNNVGSKKVIREETRDGQEPANVSKPIQTNSVECANERSDKTEIIEHTETNTKKEDPLQSKSCTDINKRIPLKVSDEDNPSTKSSTLGKKKVRDSNIIESTRI